MSYKAGDIVVWNGPDGCGARWKLIHGEDFDWVGEYVGNGGTNLIIGERHRLTYLNDPNWADEFEVFVGQVREEANCS